MRVGVDEVIYSGVTEMKSYDLVSPVLMNLVKAQNWCFDPWIAWVSGWCMPGFLYDMRK